MPSVFETLKIKDFTALNKKEKDLAKLFKILAFLSQLLQLTRHNILEKKCTILASVTL